MSVLLIGIGDIVGPRRPDVGVCGWPVVVKTGDFGSTAACREVVLLLPPNMCLSFTVARVVVVAAVVSCCTAVRGRGQGCCR